MVENFGLDDQRQTPQMDLGIDPSVMPQVDSVEQRGQIGTLRGLVTIAAAGAVLAATMLPSSDESDREGGGWGGGTTPARGNFNRDSGERAPTLGGRGATAGQDGIGRPWVNKGGNKWFE